MSSASYEVINGSLFVIGSLDRSSDAEFLEALERYVKATEAGKRAVDMSNVRWLAPSSAKVLIQVGQETQEKGEKLRILASRHVMQTLNLLGAKSWLTIESCSVPNTKPAPPETEANETKILPADEAAPAPSASQDSPTVSPAAASASSAISGLTPAVVADTGGGMLASPVESLAGGANLLRALSPNRRYSFHFYGGEQILGIVRGRIGGSWLMLDTHGTRKLINLDLVQYCEIL